jgi:lysophospholipase L1-like esterase
MPRKTLFTIACLLAFLRIPDLLPAFANYRVFDWSTVPSVFDFAPRRSMAEEQERLRPDVEKTVAHSAAYLQGNVESFLAALDDLETRREGVVRILHYGDSPTTADQITADVRELLQKRFGDAGHGYHLVNKPWAWYEHRGVSTSARGWRIEAATQPPLTGRHFGLGGVSFKGKAGARTEFRFRSPQTSAEIDAGDALASIRQESPYRWILELAGPGQVFGVTFRNGQPGVLYDSLGLNGASITVLAKTFEEAHWADRLRRAGPSLVIINYGTNESVYERFVDTAFETELRAAIGRIQRAVPPASILLMSPMDRGIRSSTGEIVTVPALNRLVNIEQRVAAELGIGFFNTFAAMGGPGTMARWYQTEPRLVNADFIHPMPAGARIVGGLLDKALMQAFRQYQVRSWDRKLSQLRADIAKGKGQRR